MNLCFHPQKKKKEKKKKEKKRKKEKTAKFVAFFTLDKPVGVWLLKAVYMHSVYLKFCKLKVKTVCVLKFTVYNVKDFIYYRKYTTSKTLCV